MKIHADHEIKAAQERCGQRRDLARLNAAAPELLEACKKVLDYALMDELLRDGDPNDAFGIRVSDLRGIAVAVAKAEGRG